jgi:hypothetical protein
MKCFGSKLLASGSRTLNEMKFWSEFGYRNGWMAIVKPGLLPHSTKARSRVLCVHRSKPGCMRFCLNQWSFMSIPSTSSRAQYALTLATT